MYEYAVGWIEGWLLQVLVERIDPRSCSEGPHFTHREGEWDGNRVRNPYLKEIELQEEAEKYLREMVDQAFAQLPEAQPVLEAARRFDPTCPGNFYSHLWNWLTNGDSNAAKAAPDQANEPPFDRQQREEKERARQLCNDLPELTKDWLRNRINRPFAEEVFGEDLISHPDESTRCLVFLRMISAKGWEFVAWEDPGKACIVRREIRS